MTKQSFEITAYDKQGEIDFVGYYPTYKQALEAAEYLRETAIYSEVKVSRLGEVQDEIN
ncbi:hypothetical protein [Gallibacterium salpingitidis]|uniref:hypothetical protein n=1 Tax=Gallibacterium salpingitidis TaxID=505341 RepID=UPI0012E83B98|nr:hypothetical protein [Gallibacterium salpingitidis]